jgi:hypothetical protein
VYWLRWRLEDAIEALEADPRTFLAMKAAPTPWLLRRLIVVNAWDRWAHPYRARCPSSESLVVRGWGALQNACPVAAADHCRGKHR